LFSIFEGIFFRDDDIWIVSFPKSGTSWTIENVWSLLNIEDLKKGKVGNIIKQTKTL